MGRALDRAETAFDMAAPMANIILNAAMDVSQENGTTLVTLTNGAGKYIVDQWNGFYTNAAAVVKAQQNAITTLAGFSNSYLMQATTAFGALAAGDVCLIGHLIEGYRWQRLSYGTANAQTSTLSFWINATVAGTASVAIRNAAANRSYVANFTVNNAATWEYKTITIPGDTTGTWPTGNVLAATLTFCFATGSTLQGTNNAWQAGSFCGTSSTTNFFTTINNQVLITGVTLVPGSEGPSSAHSSFNMRSYAEELPLCMRYWETGQEPQLWAGGGLTGAGFYGSMTFTVPKRAAPTMSVGTAWTYYTGSSGGAVTPTFAPVNTTMFGWTSSGLTNANGWTAVGTWKADARM
jgi:hypothetical protein